MLIPKWLNKWLTPEEEEELRDPSKRVFTFGLLASVATLAIPNLHLSPCWTTIQHVIEWEPSVNIWAPLDINPGDDLNLDGVRYHISNIGGTWLGLDRATVINPGFTSKITMEQTHQALLDINRYNRQHRDFLKRTDGKLRVGFRNASYKESK